MALIFGITLSIAIATTIAVIDQTTGVKSSPLPWHAPCDPAEQGAELPSISRLWRHLQLARPITADNVVMGRLHDKLHLFKIQLRRLKNQLEAGLPDRKRRGLTRQFRRMCREMGTLPNPEMLTTVQQLQTSANTLASVASLVDLVRRSELQYAQIVHQSQTNLVVIVDIERTLYPVLCDIATALDERHAAINNEVSRLELVASNRLATNQRNSDLIGCSLRVVQRLIYQLGQWRRTHSDGR